MNMAEVRLFARAPSCEGKERFVTFALADRIAGRVGRRHKGMRAQAYRCVECGGYHVGSSVGRSG